MADRWEDLQDDPMRGSMRDAILRMVDTADDMFAGTASTIWRDADDNVLMVASVVNVDGRWVGVTVDFEAEDGPEIRWAAESSAVAVREAALIELLRAEHAVTADDWMALMERRHDARARLKELGIEL